MNTTQIQTTLAPLVAAIAGFLAGKGYFGLDAQTWIAVLGAIGTIGATIWGAIAASKKGVVAASASYQDTKVVTDAATANAIPNSDVVSNTEAKVVPK